MKYTSSLLGLVLLCVSLLAACGRSEADVPSSGGLGGGGSARGGPPGTGGSRGGQRSVSAMPVEVATVERRAIADFIETNGSLEAENEVDIIARIDGPITALSAEEGQRVSEGQVLAEIDRDEVLADLELAQVSVEENRIAFERARVSWENELISQETFDQAKSRLEAAQAQIRSIEIQLGYTTIRAPFSGWIVERAIKLAEHVNVGTRLFRLSDFDPLLCEIQIPEKDLSKLRTGQLAYLEVEAFGEDRFDARVLRVSPIVDSATGTVKVTLEVAGRGRLRPGMFANVFLQTDVHEDALVIPKAAMVLESIGDTVYVLEGGVANRREIEVGFEESDAVEVLTGLNEGERVVVIGQDALSDQTPAYVLSESEENPPRPPGEGGFPVAGGGQGDSPSPEMLNAMRSRMKERGLSEDQIEARIEQMRGGAAGGGTPGESPNPDGWGGATSAAPEEEETSPTPSTDDPGDARAGTGDPGGDRLEAMRSRLRSEGRSGELGSESSSPTGRPGGPFGSGEMSPERIEFLRNRMRDRGMDEESIDRMIERLEKGEPPFPEGRPAGAFGPPGSGRTTEPPKDDGASR